MFVLCPNCWNEIHTTPAICPQCGTNVDLYSREYEKKLVAAVPQSSADRRARICWVLGSRGKRSAVPVLIDLLHDPDVLVRVAALRGLGEIGDESAIPAIQKTADSDNPGVKTIAKHVLEMLKPAVKRRQHRLA
jgi:HEAT repeat protein